MDEDSYFPTSPGGALGTASPERVNQQRSSLILDSPTRLARQSHSHSRDSSVHEKISAFNSLAFQGKTLERKTNDAALKRAMLGREEAESEMRRYRDEKRLLQREVEEGRERERKVAERLEAYMEKYGRAKESWTHKSTQLDKEVRRIRKEAYHTQSRNVELQEELKSSRSAMQSIQVDLANEKERSQVREQEAFAARYELVGVQEELAKMQEQIKLVEQERDALRTIAKNEEVARIAAEGQIPLPISTEDDEFSSPKKKSRKSLDLITRSAASEEEMEDIVMQLEWQRQNAKRAHDQVEFLELECKLKCCNSASLHAASHHEEEPGAKKLKMDSIRAASSTIYVPSEGVFRSTSPVPADTPTQSPVLSPTKSISTPVKPPTSNANNEESPSYARTPSCEPPNTALVPDINTSLLSLLGDPQSPSSTNCPTSPTHVPTTPTQTFHTISTTTRIPLAGGDETPKPRLGGNENTPLAPTMTREQALAQIAERRGRARSLAQGTLTPRKQMVEGGVRRDISAPAIRSGNVRGRSQARV